jgi:hypothetical protein
MSSSVLPSKLPAKLRESNVGVDSWSVQLVKSKGLGDYLLDDSSVNMLKPSNDPYQDAFGPEDFVGWLNPSCDESIMGKDFMPCVSPPPFLAKRVVKVENFYVTFRVGDYHFVEGKRGVMESLTLDVEFTNRYDGPRKTALNKSIQPIALSLSFINLF